MLLDKMYELYNTRIVGQGLVSSKAAYEVFNFELVSLWLFAALHRACCDCPTPGIRNQLYP